MNAFAWPWPAFLGAIATIAAAGYLPTWLERPYRCKPCNRSFVDRQELAHHLKTFHHE